MRVLLKLTLDCDVDAARRALADPEAFRSVAGPFVQVRPVSPDRLPAAWSSGERYDVALSLLGAVPLGRQRIAPVFGRIGDARVVRDDGGGLTGAVGLVTGWQHTMAVSPLPDGRTLYRDRLRVSAGLLTPAVWLSMWVYWQWRAARLRTVSGSWR